jgi:hypothetical protein
VSVPPNGRTLFAGSLSGTVFTYTIRALAAPDFIENIIMSNPVTILLKGGYSDAGFSNQSGYSTISGYLKIRGGKLTVERVKIKAP